MRSGRKLALVAATTVGWLGCAKPNQFQAPPPPEVTVATPVEREVAEALEFTGWTEATDSVDLRSRVNGYLEQVPFEDGAMVEKGQLLFVIEQEPFEAALAASEAEVAKAEAALQLEQSEYNRIVPLVQRGASTEADLDVAAAELATAKANVAAAEAALRQAQLNLSYTEIRSPVKGRIGRRLVDPGNIVQAEQTLLGRVESYSPIYVYFSISESDLLKYVSLTVDNGGSLETIEADPPKLYLGLSNEEGYPREGRFDFSERTLDRQTGTAMLRGVFENDQWTLIPGLFVRIKAPVGSARPRMLVQERAVGVDQRGEYLLVVDGENKIERRPVKLGMVVDGMRIVDDGLEMKDRVVVNGLQRAREGAVVVPKLDGEPAAAATAVADAGKTDTANKKN
jgi:RND family efflux transporter MFP subunit